MTCGGCGREVRGGATGCVYCGWSGDAETARRFDAGRVTRERFRSGATLVPFFVAAVLLSGFACIPILDLADGRAKEPLLDVLLIVACALFGPLMLLVQALRRSALWVQTEPERGLNVRGRIIPWSEIADVEHRVSALSPKGQYERVFSRFPRGITCLIYLLFPAAFCVAVLVLVLYFVFVPMLVVLSPLCERVTLRLRSGERLVLRDYEDSERLVRMVRYSLTR